MLEETESLLLDCGVSKWYVESMKKIRYLFPKTNLITQAKRELLIYNQKMKNSRINRVAVEKLVRQQPMHFVLLLTNQR